MYKSLIRPLLFLLSPEKVHHLIVHTLKISFHIPGIAFFIRKYYEIRSDLLKREFCGIQFKNPVGFAAGFDKNAEVYREFSSFGFGFIEIGTVTPKPQPGNEKPRSFRLPQDKALINRMGFNNHGVNVAAKRLARRDKKDLIIGGNIGKNTLTPNSEAIHDYVYGFTQLYDYVDYFVVNLSCPNIKNLKELQDKDQTTEILNKLSTIRAEKESYKPILLKISPDLNNEQLDDILDIYKETRIDGIVATNTTVSRDGLTTDKSRIDEIGNGGLSGAPLSKRSTEIITYLHNHNQDLPIMAVGGIMSVEDVLEKIEAGADLIQLYTGFIYEGPGFVKRINKAILEKSKSK